jgi:archaemetzincin
LVYERGG